jgi:hypothetical protein
MQLASEVSTHLRNQGFREELYAPDRATHFERDDGYRFDFVALALPGKELDPVPLHLRERDMQLRTAFGCMKPAADETYSTLQLLVAVYGSMAKVQLDHILEQTEPLRTPLDPVPGKRRPSNNDSRSLNFSQNRTQYRFCIHLALDANITAYNVSI